MALSVVRRSILCRIRAQTQSLNGRLRSLSSTTCDSLRSLSSTEEDQISSLKIQPSNADTSDKLLDQTIVTTTSDSSYIDSSDASYIDSSDLSDDEEEDPVKVSERNQINSLASFVTSKVDEIVKFGEPPFPLLYGAQVHCNYYGGGYLNCQYDETHDVKLVCMLRFLNFIKDSPIVDKIQFFQAKVYYESMLHCNFKDELTKDEIIAGVLKVVQSYPKSANYEVREETHFCKDLGFDKRDVIEIIQALQVEFKLDIPDDIDSCKLAIDYIYDHRMERLCREEFRKRFIITEDSGCRIYLRAGEMGTKHMSMSDSGSDKQSRETKTNWEGINLSQFYVNILSTYFPGWDWE